MPIIIQSDTLLPVEEELRQERVHIINRQRAESQDIRPLRIGLLNLMPAAVLKNTEIQFLRLLGDTPLQIEPVLLKFDQFKREKGADRLKQFYLPISQIKEKQLDGLIITGANLELNDSGDDFLNFAEIEYYQELKELIQWSRQNISSTIYCCFAAHFALKHFYNLDRNPLAKKILSVHHYTLKSRRFHNFLRGLNDVIPCPNARWGNISLEKVKKVKNLNAVLANEEDWLLLVGNRGKEIYIQGHPEYDRMHLDIEYKRDKDLGLVDQLPRNYYRNDKPEQGVLCNWQADASVLYRNWIDFVYQNTEY